MRLVSTTLAGPSSAPIIGDALRSVVGIVDACLVLMTGTPFEDCTALMAALAPFGDKVTTVQWTWQNDFSAARNAALDQAKLTGADWALTLDTDERIEPNEEDIRSFLESTSAPVVGMMASDGTYTKPRAFRIPATIRWEGATHEAFPANGPTLKSARFSELPKTPEDLRSKFARDAEILRREIEREPINPRWHYYLGASLHGLDQLVEAIEAFRCCARLRGWNEESAWACYRAAELLVILGRYDEAIEACGAGLIRHAGIAELAWLAGLASFRAGRHDQAMHWSKLAQVHGDHGDLRALNSRLGFRAPMGLNGGPADVLHHAQLALGENP